VLYGKNQKREKHAIIIMKKGLTGVTTKNLYKGQFNWFGEVHVEYTHASSPAQAYRQLLSKLTADYEYPFVSTYFATKGHYKIEEVRNGQDQDPKIQENRSPIQRDLFPNSPFENDKQR
jgi:hypothetical protein